MLSSDVDGNVKDEAAISQAALWSLPTNLTQLHRITTSTSDNTMFHDLVDTLVDMVCATDSDDDDATRVVVEQSLVALNSAQPIHKLAWRRDSWLKLVQSRLLDSV